MEAVLIGLWLGRRLGVLLGSAVRVAGMPLLCAPLVVLRSIGVRRFVLLVAKHVLPEVYRSAKELADLGFEIDIVGFPLSKLEFWRCLTLARDFIGSKTVIASMLNYLHSPDIPARVLKEGLKSRAVLAMGADSNPAYADTRRACKLLVDERGVVRDAGWSIPEFNYVSVGLAAARVEAFEFARRAKSSEELRRVLRSAARDGVFTAVDVTGAPWYSVYNPRDLEGLIRGRARPLMKSLLRILRKYGSRALPC